MVRQTETLFALPASSLPAFKSFRPTLGAALAIVKGNCLVCFSLLQETVTGEAEIQPTLPASPSYLGYLLSLFILHITYRKDKRELLLLLLLFLLEPVRLTPGLSLSTLQSICHVCLRETNKQSAWFHWFACCACSVFLSRVSA